MVSVNPSQTLTLNDAFNEIVRFMRARADFDMQLYVDWTAASVPNYEDFEALSADNPTRKEINATARAIGATARTANVESGEFFCGLFIKTTLREISKVARQGNSWTKELEKAQAESSTGVPFVPPFKPWVEGMNARRNFKRILPEMKEFERTEIFPRLDNSVQEVMKNAYDVASV